jgi:hypothetical protein
MGIEPEELEQESAQAVPIRIPKATQLVNVVSEIAFEPLLVRQLFFPLMKRRQNRRIPQLEEGDDHANPRIRTQRHPKGLVWQISDSVDQENT